MNLVELQERAHAIAEADGWWDEEPPFGDVIASAALRAKRGLRHTRGRYRELAGGHRIPTSKRRPPSGGRC